MQHPWLETELARLLAALPEPVEVLSAAENRRRWERWQEGRTVRIALPDVLPPLRLLLVLDNLTGHRTALFVLRLFAHGIMPLHTPLRTAIALSRPLRRTRMSLGTDVLRYFQLHHRLAEHPHPFAQEIDIGRQLHLAQQLRQPCARLIGHGVSSFSRASTTGEEPLHDRVRQC